MNTAKLEYTDKIFTTYKQIWLDIDKLPFGEPVLWKMDKRIYQYVRRISIETPNTVCFESLVRYSGVHKITKLKGFRLPIEYTLSFEDIIICPTLQNNQEAFDWLVENCKDRIYIQGRFVEMAYIISVVNSPLNKTMLQLTTISRRNKKVNGTLFLLECFGELKRPPAAKGKRKLPARKIIPKPTPALPTKNSGEFYSNKDWWMGEYQF
jgi:hypothetical protein